MRFSYKLLFLLILSGRASFSQDIPDNIQLLISESDSLLDSHPAKSLEVAGELLEISNTSNDHFGIYKAHLNKGIILWGAGRFDPALKELHEAKKVVEVFLKDRELLGPVYNNISRVYLEIGDYEMAYTYLRLSIEINQEFNSQKDLASNYVNLGILKLENFDLDSAALYFTVALEIYQTIDDRIGIVSVYNNFGLLESYNFNYEAERDYYRKGLEITPAENEARAQLLFNLASSFFGSNDFENAKTYAFESLKCSEKIRFIRGINISSILLSKIHEAQGDFKNALTYYQLGQRYADTLINKETLNKVTEIEVASKFESQIEIDSINNAKKQQLHDAELKVKEADLARTRIQQIALLIGVALFVFISIFMYNRWKITKAQKSIIEQQKSEVERQQDELKKAHLEITEAHKEITDSIDYAQRIQKAILPPDKLWFDKLPDSFVLYKPKDVVAGDFYWMESDENKLFFAAADCTGHGVPGAMVSVLCVGGLNRSVREYGCSTPGQILDKTREIVIKEFEKSEDEVKDGMDIALCSIHNNKLEFAGAHNPLWVIRKGVDEVEELKANKQPIGKFENMQPYTTHELCMNPGDTAYIFSDGFADQFGGDKGKKFKSANFKRLLLKIQNEPMDRQKEIIEIEFEKWRGKIEQIDDVCVIGIRF